MLFTLVCPLPTCLVDTPLMRRPPCPLFFFLGCTGATLAAAASSSPSTVLGDTRGAALEPIEMEGIPITTYRIPYATL